MTSNQDKSYPRRNRSLSIPRLRILESSVCLGSPSLRAAPAEPAICPPLSVRAASIKANWSRFPAFIMETNGHVLRPHAAPCCHSSALPSPPPATGIKREGRHNWLECPGFADCLHSISLSQKCASGSTTRARLSSARAVRSSR